MSDTLFEMADFFTPPAPTKYPPQMLVCGLHRQFWDEMLHAAECWGGACPACGDEIRCAFDVSTNHLGAERGICQSMELRLNHLTYAIRYGEKPNERDLGVIDLGWRIGPDGSQIPPAGMTAARGWFTWSTREDFERWVAHLGRGAA